MTAAAAFFYLFAAITVASGFMVIASRNPVTSVLFLILAFIIFMMVKWINRLKAEAPAAPAESTEEVKLLREIRDALKK